MTALVTPKVSASFRGRLAQAAVNLIVGTFFCLSPLTALIVLGWMTRRMRARIDARLYRDTPLPGWFLGPKGKGFAIRLAGGLAANIRAGVVSATGLAILTLPFTVLWLGAWWAGWENSFNKGYEQSAVGPATWMIATMLALPVLTHLPMALAHASAEGRLAAFFEFRRIRSLVIAAGWRVPWLAFLSVLLCLPLLGLRAFPVFVEDLVPGFALMSVAEQVRVADGFGLVGAALTFVILLFLRDRASTIYCRAIIGAAHGRSKDVWQDHDASNSARYYREPSRPMAVLWLIMSCVIWLGLPVLMVIGQFLNYTTVLWLTHPVFLLPWAG